MTIKVTWRDCAAREKLPQSAFPIVARVHPITTWYNQKWQSILARRKVTFEATRAGTVLAGSGLGISAFWSSARGRRKWRCIND